jgi:hypothetical protein
MESAQNDETKVVVLLTIVIVAVVLLLVLYCSKIIWQSLQEIQANLYTNHQLPQPPLLNCIPQATQTNPEEAISGASKNSEPAIENLIETIQTHSEIRPIVIPRNPNIIIKPENQTAKLVTFQTPKEIFLQTPSPTLQNTSEQILKSENITKVEITVPIDEQPTLRKESII